MRAVNVLIGADWNEPPTSVGTYSAEWVARSTGCRVVAGQRGSMGRIDFLVTDAYVATLRTYGNGGSDHDLRWFYVRPQSDSGLYLLGALWNVERDRHPALVVGHLVEFIRDFDPHFMLLQEIQQYHQALGRIPGYRLLAMPGRGIDQNGILVKDGVKVSGFRVRKMAPWTWRTASGKEHASPYMPHACLNDWLRVASAHEMSRIDWRKGKMVGPRDRRRIRRVSARRMVRWVELVRAGTWDQ